MAGGINDPLSRGAGITGADTLRIVPASDATFKTAPAAPTATATGSPSLTSNFGTAAAANVTTVAGNVLAVEATSINAAVRYLQLHNKASIPLAGETPLYSIALPAGSATGPTLIVLGSDFFLPAGKNFTLGIGWAFSTTLATYTAATPADHSIHLHYI